LHRVFGGQAIAQHPVRVGGEAVGGECVDGRERLFGSATDTVDQVV
jgi:hypothetical protein